MSPNWTSASFGQLALRYENIPKTITLTEQQDDWVKGQIESGHFGSGSEYIRALIRRGQQAKDVHALHGDMDAPGRLLDESRPQ
jgi:antitoxin ParD1/3/4